MYIPAFEQSRISLGKEDLLWVGDCTMGAMARRSYMHHHHQFYLVPLARTGQVPELLAQSIREMESQAATLHRVTPLRYDGSEGGSLRGYVTQRGVEGQTPEGYPVCWQERVFLVHSLTHEQQQQQGLEQRLKTAEKKLLKLTPPVGRGRKQLRTEAELVQKATAILKAQHVDGLLTYEFVFEPQTKTHQSRYQIIQVNRQEAAIEQSQQTFGWRMYVSNALAGRLSFEEAVLTYRNEWILEHGFHRFKGKSLGAHPVFVKRDDQVKGLLHLLSLGLRVLTLIEYVVHRQPHNNRNILSPCIRTLYPSPRRHLAR